MYIRSYTKCHVYQKLYIYIMYYEKNEKNTKKTQRKLHFFTCEKTHVFIVSSSLTINKNIVMLLKSPKHTKT